MLKLFQKKVPVGLIVICYHRLRGSASTVLTATGLVDGKGQTSTPTESTPLPITKNCHRCLYRRPPHLCQIWCKSVRAGLCRNG